jgi:anti-sigma factor RsiW
MKPCSKNRKLIAWLALDALDARQMTVLRAHLETCEGCRRYLEEISNVTERLRAAKINPDVQASESFHRNVADTLRAEESNSIWEIVAVYLRRIPVNGRVALLAAVALAVAVVALATLRQHPNPSPRTQPVAQVVPGPNLDSDLAPSIANYQMVANQSLEKLDELLTRQGNRNLPPTPIYTASTLVPANFSD